MKFIKCPLCGSEFSNDEMKNATCSKCPFAKGCDLICCPHCNYQFVNESKTMNLLAKRFGKIVKKGAGHGRTRKKSR